MKIVTVGINEQSTHIHGTGGICLLEESWMKLRRMKEQVSHSSSSTKKKVK